MSRGSYCISRHCYNNKFNNPEIALFQLPKTPPIAKKRVELADLDAVQTSSTLKKARTRNPKVYSLRTAKRFLKYKLKSNALRLNQLKYCPSPKGYKHLMQTLNLPTPRTIRRWQSCIRMDPGINNHNLESIKLYFKQFQEKEEQIKLITLISDDISLKKEIHYDANKDKVIGVVNTGKIRTNDKVKTNNFKLISKVGTEYLNMTSFNAMKIKYAAQIFSDSMSVALLLLKHLGVLDDGSEHTTIHLILEEMKQAFQDCKFIGARRPACLKEPWAITKNDKPLRTVLMNSHLALTPKKDRRGGTSKKFERSLIMTHIRFCNPMTSHYRHAHAPNRLYLPSDINIRLMYEYFKAKYNVSRSYYLYRQMVSKMNISFAKLGNEECFACEKYEIHRKESSHVLDEDDIVCRDCESFKYHRQKYIKAREIYTSDAKTSANPRVCAADLQKVIMLPRCDTFKEFLFTPRLIAFNQSFVAAGNYKISPVAVLWHEAISGRKKNDILSTFYAFLNNIRDSEDIVIWLDNCSEQNKNWCLYTFFVYAVNSNELNFKTITLKYFEPGHSIMAADSFHHRVERLIKRQGKVYDFVNFINAVKTSSHNTEVIEMLVNAFYSWKDESSQYKLTRMTPRPYLNQMVEVQFTRGQLSKKPAFKQQPRGISEDRKQTIPTPLGQIVPPNRLHFRENLPVSQSQDAIDDD
ncbi:hypothetical protein ILUMI_27244 [Ignelater luminosus]|uniref:Transposable element P transposase-like RNase H domain-containing protein n=1 Tax=Ignelater luminosus TaxID=2038154 RepID=A0A8K0C8B1_IGNLU|nr:hypothetical protein ILUMI_27244 [Ignelater luminosus]